MNKLEIQEALEDVLCTTGFQLQAESDFDAKNREIHFRFAGLGDHDTFFFEVQRTPIVWHLNLRFDTFARPLVQRICTAAENNEVKLQEQLLRIRAAGFVISCGYRNASEAGQAPYESPHFSLEIQTSPLRKVAVGQPRSEVAELAKLLQTAALVVSDLLSNFEDSQPDVIGEAFAAQEGQRSQAFCGKYERSARNRALCLEHFGFTCVACGVTPELIYGPIGKRIIHIHHLVPLSQMDEPKPVNPISDLVPLCPNCHNLAHKRIPPFSPSEVKNLMNDAPLGQVKAARE